MKVKDLIDSETKRNLSLSKKIFKYISHTQNY